jgi:hypothetical protein
MRRSSRTRGLAVSAGVLVAALALLVPSIALAATTVTAIPGSGWIQGPDNTAGRTAVIAASPAAGQGTGAVKLTVTANTQFVGIGRPVAAPLSDIVAGSWMTYVPGTSGNIAAEPAAFKFGMYRLGGTSEFTTLVVERYRNGTVTANTWQQTDLSGTTMVWQSNAAGNFCVQATPCTLADFKTQYPAATVLGLQVAIGTGTEPVTSFVDGISLTVGETSNTWDFELAAQPTPSRTPGATKTPSITPPPTDLEHVDATPSIDSRAFIVLGVAGLVALLMVRPRRSRRNR